MDTPADLTSAARQHRIRATIACGRVTHVCYLRRAADGQIIIARRAEHGSAFDAVESKAAQARFAAMMKKEGSRVTFACVVC